MYIICSDTAHSYASLLGKVDEMAIKMVFESYGIEKQYESFASSFSHLLRFIKYKDPVSTDNDIRLAAHTDKNFTTIVHQNNLGGLEVQLNDGNWISLDPKPSHFLFMAGDAMKVSLHILIQPFLLYTSPKFLRQIDLTMILTNNHKL